MAEHPAYTMAGLCALGGVMGYVKGRSMPSLVAGLAFGTAYGVAGYLIHKNKDHGHDLAAATSSVLMVAMLPRGLRTRKPLPLLLASLGMASGAYHFRKAYEERHGV
ncbi:transmembrane proteins 14C-domain-containing protein [Syncephalis plumigaleata]|nr:transmembrane proteins 14C-domain-containing protein [Syncephalis plumigaleata]